MARTLEWSSMDHDRSGILVLDNTDSATRFFHKVFAKVEDPNRLVITKDRYFYAPSEDYKNTVLRFKGLKKK